MCRESGASPFPLAESAPCEYDNRQMPHRTNREEWLRDVDARQRNIVFPDTVQNEARFWRNLYRGKQFLTVPQVIGLLLLLILFAGPPIAITVGMWRETQGVWWQKIIALYGGWLLFVGVIGGFLMIFARYARHRRQGKHR